MGLPANRLNTIKLPDNTEYEIIPEKISDGHGNFAILPELTLASGETSARLATKDDLVTLSGGSVSQIQMLTMDNSQKLNIIKDVRDNTTQLNGLVKARNFVNYCSANLPYNILSYTWDEDGITKTMTAEDAWSIYNKLLADNYATFKVIGNDNNEIISSMLLTDTGGLVWQVKTENNQYVYSQSERSVSINDVKAIDSKDFQSLNFKNSNTIGWTYTIDPDGIIAFYANVDTNKVLTTNTQQTITGKKIFSQSPQLDAITMSYYNSASSTYYDADVMWFYTDWDSSDTNTTGTLTVFPNHFRIDSDTTIQDDKKPISNFITLNHELYTYHYATGITVKDYNENEDESTYYKLSYPAKSGTIATVADTIIDIVDLTSL